MSFETQIKIMIFLSQLLNFGTVEGRTMNRRQMIVVKNSVDERNHEIESPY